MLWSVLAQHCWAQDAFWQETYFPNIFTLLKLFYDKLLTNICFIFLKENFDKILAKYAKAHSVRKYVQFHGLGSQLAVIREEWGILKRECGSRF